MEPDKIRCTMDAAEHMYTEDCMATRETYPLLRPEQWEQVQEIYNSAYWHQVFIERGRAK